MSTFQLLATYHSADYELIRTIKSQLAAQGHHIAVQDSSTCVGGAAWPQKLGEKLKTTQAAVVFIGKYGLSEGQKRWIDLALAYQTRLEQSGRSFPVIPVLLPEADLAPAFLFNNVWIDLRAGITDPQALQRLVQAVENPTGQRRPPVVLVDHCPYRGLRPFREEDAAFFFGREAWVERLLTALQQQRWVTLSGPTGSGKTSLIRAGLFPALRRQSTLACRWEIVYVRPLNRPLLQLAAGLLAVSSPHEPATLRAATLANQLANQERSLAALIEEILPKSTPDTQLLLVIDQFEELVTSSSPEQGAFFFNVLQPALDHPALSLLTALRSENYGQLLDLSQTFADRLTNEVIQVTPLPPEALRQAILKPARLVTMAVEPLLVQHLIDTTANLSLIQFCLTELWRQNRDRLLSWATFERIGGLDGAMTYRAEQIFASLSPAQQQMAGRILCSLVDVSHPAGISAPQRLKLADLYARMTPPKFSTLHPKSGNATTKVPSRAVENTVIEAFARDGLLTLTKAPTGDDEFIELATPALIDQWPRFQIWLDQAQAFRLWRRRLTPALAKWENSHRSDELLLRKDALFEAKRWLRDYRDQLDRAEQAFIQQSLVRQRRAQASRWLAGLAALALLVWIISALFLRQFSVIRQVAERRDLALAAQAQTELALQQAESEQVTAVARQQAVEQQRQVALARQLAAQARLILNDPDGPIPQAMSLAVESLRRSPSLESQQVLRAGLARLPRPTAKLQHDGEVGGGIFSPSGQWLATRSGSIVRIWDVATGKELARLKHDGPVNDIAFSPDNRWLATASLDHTARMWDVHTGWEVARLRRDTPVWKVAFSSDGQWLATRSDQEASVWRLTPGTAGSFTPNASTSAVVEPDTPLTFVQLSAGQPHPETTSSVIGSESVRMAHDEAVLAMALSEDARWLATASSDHTARVWEVATGREIYRLPHQDSVQAVAFSPNGRFLATGGSDNIARIWLMNPSAITSNQAMPTSPEMIRLLHRSKVNQVVFSPDSNWLVTVSDDNIARGWRLASNPDSKAMSPWLKTEMKHQARIEAVTFSPDGRWLATASADQTARIWLVTTGQELAQLPHLSPVNGVVFSPDGRGLATVSTDHTAQLWPVPFGYEVAQYKHEGWIFSVDFSPDGRRLAIRSELTVQLWDGATGREITQLKHRSYVNAVAFSPDGHTIATGSYGTAQLWDVATGEEIDRLADAGQIQVLAFSPDGRRLATAGNEKIARIWDVETGQVIAELPHHSWITAIAFSPDPGGQWLATASNDKTARVWDAATGQEVSRLGHDAVVTQVAFSPDGQWLATASDDHTARIWLTNSVWELARMPHSDPVLGVTFSPDGRWLATRSRQLVQVWEAATGERMTEMKHDGPVETIIFSPDSRQLATAGDDRIVRVWDVTTGQEITRLEHKYWINAVAISPDGRWLATASADHIVRVWFLRQDDLLAEVCARLPRNLTLQEWQTYLPDDPYRPTCPNLPAVTE